MTTQELLSFGYLVERLRRPPGWIEMAIRDLGIQPTQRVDGVAFYTPEAERQIFEHFRQQDMEAVQRRRPPA